MKHCTCCIRKRERKLECVKKYFKTPRGMESRRIANRKYYYKNRDKINQKRRGKRENKTIDIRCPLCNIKFTYSNKYAIDEPKYCFSCRRKIRLGFIDNWNPQTVV